jgi:microcystin-dependent protein
MPFAGEIRLFAGNVAPGGWAFCHGQLASIASVPELHEAIGTRYGGDGRTTFALPDLRGRVPVHRSSRIALGAEGGAEVVTLEADQVPGHRHALMAGTSTAPDGERAVLTLAGSTSTGQDATGSALALGQTTLTGSGNSHSNVQPYLCLNYIIALSNTPSDGSDGPIVGEVRLFAGEGAPAGWTPCNGQAVDIRKYAGLYSVIGTTYGGNGQTVFALPDVRGRVVMQAGYRPGLSARQLGESGGAATVELDDGQLPPHSHEIEAVAAGGSAAGAAVMLRTTNTPDDTDEDRPMASVSTGSAGGNGQHTNLQPYLALNYLIAHSGKLPEPE